MKNSIGIGGFELFGGSETRERKYDSEKIKVSKETRKKLGHFASQGSILDSDVIM